MIEIAAPHQYFTIAKWLIFMFSASGHLLLGVSAAFRQAALLLLYIYVDASLTSCFASMLMLNGSLTENKTALSRTKKNVHIHFPL